MLECMTMMRMRAAKLIPHGAPELEHTQVDLTRICRTTYVPVCVWHRRMVYISSQVRATYVAPYDGIMQALIKFDTQVVRATGSLEAPIQHGGLPVFTIQNSPRERLDQAVSAFGSILARRWRRLVQG